MDGSARYRSCHAMVRLRPLHGFQHPGRRLCRNVRSSSARPWKLLRPDRTASNRRSNPGIEAVFRFAISSVLTLDLFGLAIAKVGEGLLERISGIMIPERQYEA